MKPTTSLSVRTPVPALIAALLAGSLSAQWTGEWPMDISSGSIAPDVTGNGNDGTLINFGVSPWVTGAIGNALQFDGVDDYVSLVSQGSIYDGLGSPYSVAYWVKAPAQQNRFVYAEGTLGTQAILIFGSGQFLPDADKFRVYCRNDQGNEPFIGVSDTVVYDDTWHHVAFVDVAGDITLYIDGVVDTATIAYDPTRLPGSPGFGTFSLNTASIGALRRGTVCCHTEGEIDDLRLYQFAMSATDVAQAMVGSAVLPPSASIGEYGVGCGAGPLAIEGSGSAVIGGPGINLQVQNGQPGSLAVLACGLNAIVPLDLSVSGFPGCTLYPANFATAFLGVVDANGDAPAFLFPIPINPSLSFTQLNCQGAALVGSTLEFSDVVLAVLGG